MTLGRQSRSRAHQEGPADREVGSQHRRRTGRRGRDKGDDGLLPKGRQPDRRAGIGHGNASSTHYKGWPSPPSAVFFVLRFVPFAAPSRSFFLILTTLTSTVGAGRSSTDGSASCVGGGGAETGWVARCRVSGGSSPSTSTKTGGGVGGRGGFGFGGFDTREELLVRRVEDGLAEGGGVRPVRSSWTTGMASTSSSLSST